MSRVSIKSKDDLPAELKPLWDKMTTYGAFENQAGVMAHRPAIFKHVWSLLVDLADEAVLSKRHLELALVTVSLLNKCDYCVSHHAPKLAIQGVSEQGAERLLDYKDHPELDTVDKLVVEYAIAVTDNWNKTRDEVFTRLREHFSEAQIVDLTWRIGAVRSTASTTSCSSMSSTASPLGKPPNNGPIGQTSLAPRRRPPLPLGSLLEHTRCLTT
jgi:uncharacterized peroxidase-related enzyme